MPKYRIKNWSKYQHYTDRNPPWIKLHWDILSSADWVSFDDASRVLAVASMLIASKNNGVITDENQYVQRVAYLNKKPNWEPLIRSGFVEVLSSSLADASTLQADASTLQAFDTQETEEETETEEDKIYGCFGELKSRISKLYHRREGTEWTKKETDGLTTVSRRESAMHELAIIESAWAAGWRFHRTDIQTLLNNWTAESDRAGQFLREKSGNGSTPVLDGIPAMGGIG